MVGTSGKCGAACQHQWHSRREHATTAMPALRDGDRHFPQYGRGGGLVRRTALLDRDIAGGARQQTVALSQLDELDEREVGLAVCLGTAAYWRPVARLQVPDAVACPQGGNCSTCLWLCQSDGHLPGMGIGV